MLPLFTQLGSLYIYTYGVFLTLGFFWACFFMWKHIRISKFAEDMSFDIAFLSFAGALIMGRILYCILHFQEFGFDILKFILVNGYPGMSAFGMILGGVGSLFFLTRGYKLKFDEFSDYVAPSLFIFSAAAELGAFISGVEPGGTALFKGIILGVSAYVSIHMFYEVRKEKVQKGTLLFLFLALYSLCQTVFHFLKDKRALLSESPIELTAFYILLLTSGFYFVYYFRALFINFITHNVKQTFKNISRKTKNSDRGGAEKDSSPDRNSQK